MFCEVYIPLVHAAFPFPLFTPCLWQHIMQTRFGCTAATTDAEYESLTLPTTAETAASFQPFETHPEEPLLLLTMFEELPAGFHVIAGLAHILRRVDGHPHPLYSPAPAVAWPTAHENSYIEFMENAFIGDLRHTRRLILHEKAHFMWSNLFTEEIRNDWINVSGWYEDASAASGWATTEDTTFVSAYAHMKNPNEDMAESISYYVENPAKLTACCQAKFQFIRDRIMHGYRYVSKIRDDLTFQVFNLFPDFVYPGKIIRVDITVSGAPTEDKLCTVEILLNAQPGVFDGAQHAYFRLFSEIGTYFDQYLMPTNSPDNSILSGSFTISKYAKAGLWVPNQITLKDNAGNQRFAGTNDFGWSMYLDNSLEDLGPPVYVEDSLTLIATEEELEGHVVTWVTASWLLTEDNGMKQHGGVYVRLVDDHEGGHSTQGLQEYGYPGLDEVGTSGDDILYRATVKILLTEFRAEANYTASLINLYDVAENIASTRFSLDSEDQTPVWVEVSTSNYDDQAPEVDPLITVTGTATNPESPNGETVVEIVFTARDDKSGVGTVNFRLLDPQGNSFFEYHYHDNFYTTFFEGDATEWQTYTINVVLPAGSAPGVWGLESLEVSDKADNNNAQSFVENMHFQVEG